MSERAGAAAPALRRRAGEAGCVAPREGVASGAGERANRGIP